MTTMKAFSEVKEAAKILGDLVAQSAVVAPAIRTRPAVSPRLFPAGQAAPSVAQPPPTTSPADTPGGEEPVYRGDKLENVLFAMSKRGGFTGSVLVDANGLPLALYNSPVDEDTIAAVTTILGEALAKAGRLLQQADANYIAMDIDYVNKAVIRRFLINDLTYFLMAICSQEIDDRAELELSIEQVTAILKRR